MQRHHFHVSEFGIDDGAVIPTTLRHQDRTYHRCLMAHTRIEYTFGAGADTLVLWWSRTTATNMAQD